MSPRDAARRLLKPAVFAACLTPFLVMTWGAVAGDLNADPIADLTNRTGLWSLRLLLITLAVTPARRLFGWPWLIAVRRMLGLFAFFYGVLHLVVYLALNQTFDLVLIVADLRRPYIIAGYLSLALMLPLAATSTARAMRRLKHRWQLLHRLVYAVAVLGVLHYLWLVKIDFRPPIAYALLLAVLLLYRLGAFLRRRLGERPVG